MVAEAVVYHANGVVKTTISLSPDTVAGRLDVRAIALAGDGNLALGYITWPYLDDPVTRSATGWDLDVAVRVNDAIVGELGAAPFATETEGNQS